MEGNPTSKMCFKAGSHVSKRDPVDKPHVDFQKAFDKSPASHALWKLEQL